MNKVIILFSLFFGAHVQLSAMYDFGSSRTVQSQGLPFDGEALRRLAERVDELTKANPLVVGFPARQDGNTVVVEPRTSLHVIARGTHQLATMYEEGSCSNLTPTEQVLFTQAKWTVKGACALTVVAAATGYSDLAKKSALVACGVQVCTTGYTLWRGHNTLRALPSHHN